MSYLTGRTTARGVILMLLLYAGAHGMQSRNFGVGFMAGTPTGISFKYWLNGINALTGGISLGSDTMAQLNYLWHDFDAIRSNEGRFPLHYGFGASVESDRDESTIAVRGVIGLTYIFARAPFDVFIEMAPQLEISKDSGFGITAAAGARYYFR